MTFKNKSYGLTATFTLNLNFDWQPAASPWNKSRSIISLGSYKTQDWWCLVIFVRSKKFTFVNEFLPLNSLMFIIWSKDKFSYTHREYCLKYKIPNIRFVCWWLSWLHSQISERDNHFFFSSCTYPPPKKKPTHIKFHRKFPEPDVELLCLRITHVGYQYKAYWQILLFNYYTRLCNSVSKRLYFYSDWKNWAMYLHQILREIRQIYYRGSLNASSTFLREMF